MMEENIKKILDQIQQHIINCAFKDKSFFIRNIKVMKFNTELEWFNCALIAMDCRSSNRFIVNTLQRWDYILGTDDENKPFLNAKPVKLLKPVYEKDNNTFYFDLIDTYYLDELEISKHKKVKYTRKSSIERVIDKKKNYAEFERILKNGWQDIFIESYLKMFDFYHFSDKAKQMFYKNLILFVFGEELKIKTPHEFSSIKFKDEEKITVYRHLHELISCFHIAFQSYLDELEALQKEIGDLSVEQPRLRSETHDLMEKLSKGISIKEEEKSHAEPTESK